ncbi:MAG: hypothetical protein AAF528_01170 [Cyanobacteria bacterium P01_C01_bin.121]
MSRKPVFDLTYNGTNITQEISELTLSVNFTDKLEGESDELAISLINSDLRWLNAWLPSEGDTAELQMGFEGEALLGPVLFEVDEPRWSGSASQGDTFTLRGLATPVTKSLRQRNTQAYEETALLAIAQQIAEKHSLEIIGVDVVPNIAIKRQTQKEQTDLGFLRDLAAEYGLLFKIESLTKLVFYLEDDLEAAPAVLALDRTDVSSYRISRKAGGTYKAATVSYQDGETGEFIEVTVDLDGAEVPKPTEEEEGAIATEDILKVRERVESRGQAEAKAIAALKRANSARVEVELSLEGEVKLVAGINIDLTGVGRLSGKYLIETAKHSLSKNQGYRSSVTCRKVN